MTSPSVRSTSRSTPCVLGCCGPMLTSISSVRTSNSMMVGSCFAAVAVAMSGPYLLQILLRLSLFQVTDFLRQDSDCLSEEANGLSELADVVRRVLAAGVTGRGAGFLFGVAGE